MDRRFANGTINAAQYGSGPPLVLMHSLLSDRASFDRIVPKLSESFRVIVPELPGFGQSEAVGGGLAAVADRMAGAGGDCAGGGGGIVLRNGYGGVLPPAEGGPPPQKPAPAGVGPCRAAVVAPPPRG